MKTVNFVSKITFAAGLCLALASTFSCSSDDGDEGGSGGGLSGLHTQPAQQVYLDGEAFNGSSYVMLVFDDYIDDYDSIDMLPVGKIENGKITLNLPNSVDSKYLKPFEYCHENANCDINKNILISSGEHLLVNISEKGSCHLRLLNLEGGLEAGYEEMAFLLYSQSSGRIQIDFIETYDDGIYTYDNTYDWNLSKGWNTWYLHAEGSLLENGNFYSKVVASTNPNTIKGTLKWTIEEKECRN